nr:retrotransposable element Tf2 [Tanacetum cinerariifolium]
MVEREQVTKEVVMEVSLFIRGPKSEIGLPVRMFKPTTLKDASCLARIHEATLALPKAKHASQYRGYRSNSGTYANRYVSSSTPVTEPVLALPSVTTENVGKVFVDEEDQEEEVCIDTKVREDTQLATYTESFPQISLPALSGVTKILPCQSSVTTPLRVDVANGSKMGEIARSFDNNLPLKQLLSTYEDVFAMPTELPPPRAHDHTITLSQTPHQQINKFTIKDKFPIHVVEDLINELYGAQVFLKLDLRDSLVESVDRSLQEREQTIQQIKFHLQRSQDRMRNLSNKHRTNRQFKVGMWVYVKLQPHRHVTLRKGAYIKLSSKYYGPFQVVKKVGQLAYQLALPATSQIHIVSHVSQLKKCTHPVEASGVLSAID